VSSKNPKHTETFLRGNIQAFSSTFLNVWQIEYSRRRSPVNAFANMVSALIVPKKTLSESFRFPFHRFFLTFLSVFIRRTHAKLNIIFLSALKSPELYVKLFQIPATKINVEYKISRILIF
jgi:hypothetical protein